MKFRDILEGAPFNYLDDYQYILIEIKWNNITSETVTGIITNEVPAIKVGIAVSDDLSQRFSKFVSPDKVSYYSDKPAKMSKSFFVAVKPKAESSDTLNWFKQIKKADKEINLDSFYGYKNEEYSAFGKIVNVTLVDRKTKTVGTLNDKVIDKLLKNPEDFPLTVNGVKLSSFKHKNISNRVHYEIDAKGKRPSIYKELLPQLNKYKITSDKHTKDGWNARIGKKNYSIEIQNIGSLLHIVIEKKDF